MKEKYFLGISFVLAWGIELILILTKHTGDGIFSFTYPLIVLVPALAVLITKYTIKEPLWMNFWLKPEGRKTVKYSIIGWLTPVVLIALGTVMYFVIFSDNFDASMSAQIEYLREGSGGLKDYTDADIRSTLYLQILLNVVMAPFYNILTSVGEEVSWRGYYLNMLCEKYEKWKAVCISGLVWGIWYLPLVISAGLFYGKDYPGYPVIGCICALIYYIVLGTFYSYLTIKTHSCIPSILANACVASMSGVGTLFFKNADDVSVFFNPMPTSVIGGIGFIITAAVLLYLFAKGRIESEESQVKVVPFKKKSVVSGSLKSRTQNEHLRRDR